MNVMKNNGCRAALAVLLTLIILAIIGLYTLYLKIGVGMLVYSSMKNDHSKMIFFIRTGVDINGKEKHGIYLEMFGQTPLTGAVEYGDISSVRMLIDKGADVNYPDGLGMYPSYMAARRGDIEIIRLLAESGADFDVLYDKISPVEWAYIYGHTEVAQEIQKILAASQEGKSGSE